MPATGSLITAFALGRVAFGVGLMAAPERVAGGWLGADAGRDAVKVAVRGLGARDVGLSVGALLYARDGERVRPWLLAALACDCVDLAATLAAGDALPRRARIGTALLAGGAAVAGGALAAAAAD